MTIVMSSTAASWYLESTLDCYAYGLCSQAEYSERLHALCGLTEDASVLRYAKELVRSRRTRLWTEDQPSEREVGSNPQLRVRRSVAVPSDPVLELVVRSVAGLPEWTFHAYDDHSFPSVPHGHNRDSKLKLDAYLGWIYDGKKPVSRLKRKVIIMLWNDDTFRSLARASIRWYMTTHITHVWRVPYPLRIPKRRTS